MEQSWRDIALIAAGVIGAVTALLHGVIMQGHMIEQVNSAVRADGRLRRPIRRLVAPLLHVSTLSWLLVGLLLIWAGVRATGEPRWIAAGFGLVIYGYAALANLIAVRGFHPGWILMTTASLLVATGLL
ncbi:CHASE2 domain-containing sensor protein [Phenylobacterium haematophilum]|uniref:CHASE2 domain-containing sensor protein n=1 Tax=Phenylobacterium haematophilum TaxID=98513 RepID=A0A839ZX52_9CAUL|nr:hypothetical protein [Phenylobacterium haematophilum]MBB3890624.1 CHASE2 domain-containing sensor protein [Phenylobacterium haematophilum]